MDRLRGGLVGGGVRFHCRAFSAKYRPVNILLFIPLSLSLSLPSFHRISVPVPSFFPRVVFRCFKLSATPACTRVLPLARLDIALDRGKKIGGKSWKRGREKGMPPSSSFERENDPSRRCFPSCRTSHVLSHASYN